METESLNLPNWIKRLPDLACITTEELAEVTNMQYSRALTKMVKNGHFPKPDREVQNQFKRPKFLWSVRYLKSLEGTEYKRPSPNRREGP